LEAILSHHRAGSSLGVLNATGALASPPRELLDVLQTAQQVFEWTGGAFDVTIQPVAQLFTHHQLRGRLPSSAEVRSTLACVGFQRVTLDPRRVAFTGEGMSITLDGIAKGSIVDAALAELTRHGYPHAMVDAGGDIGSARRKGAAWQIGIQDPRRQTGDAIAVAQLTSGALATSGDYLHTFTPDFRVHHILDPRTGLSPLELSSVSIVAPNACLADALSTGVMVLGAQSGLSLVERLPDVECLLVTKTGEVIRSEGFPMEA
jgi:thiamine biosynthesis lipoprotein